MKRLLKSVYKAVPFKREAYHVVRAILPLPEPVFRHLHFTGSFTVRVDAQASFRIMHHGHLIENELLWSGLKGWEKVSFELWRRPCPQADTILDIGANAGVYALVAQITNPRATVIAVEPVQYIYEKLLLNTRMNGGRIHGVCVPVSDQTGTANLYDQTAHEHVLSVSLPPTWNKESPWLRPVEVPCTTVADLLRTHGLTKADLLKIDVETHEPAVLDGCGTLLREHRPTPQTELLNVDVAQRVAAHVEGLGYECYKRGRCDLASSPGGDIGTQRSLQFPDLPAACGTGHRSVTTAP